jgi:hypothetical protein
MQTTLTIPEKTRRGFLRRVLDPIDRLTEAIYAILIVMTFTLAYRAVDVSGFDQKAVSEAVLSLAIAAFGCAVAWGIIDGAMFILLGMFERGENSRLLTKVKAAPDERSAIDAISQQLDETLEGVMSADERQEIYRQAYVRMRDNAPQRVGFKRADFYGAIGVVLVSIIATLPVVLPLFLLRSDVNLAMRTSNLMAIIMLFLCGYRWGKYAGHRPIIIGLMLAAFGVVVVLIAIPLGG